MELRLLKGLPVAYALAEDGRGFLVISDLHLGLTNRMGLRRPLPEEEALEICRRIRLAGKMTGARHLIMLGDLKHGLFEPSVYEKKALWSLTEDLVKDFDVWLMKGNHDYGVEEFISQKVNIIGKNGLEIDKSVLIHGHSLPRLASKMESYDVVVSGHIHPQFMLDGEWRPAWMLLTRRGASRPRRVVILPHFSLYASRAGYRPGPPASIAPFLSRLDLDRFRYEMKDLALRTVSSGKAEDAIISRN